jgi:transposase
VILDSLRYNGVVLNAQPINEIHRLYHGEHWSIRKIARYLHLARKTIRKYLDSPAPVPARCQRATKLDPFKATIGELLEQDPHASAVVIRQRLQTLGYQGGITILRGYVSPLRTVLHQRRALVRMEPSPGERFE